ncbi:MAG TPA: peptidoglycan editing factor PgeF [Beijerinckiaceae bacterium]|nr:peptidoglycan editing factor PgeF [Beijerinckiaceae bacterium]
MPIEAPELRSPHVRHAFFTREGGVSTGIYGSLNGGIGSSDDAAHVAENRRRMAERFGIPDTALVSLYQIHSAEAVIVERPWGRDARPRADAMATRVPGIALAISTADCGPVLFADAEARVIGAAHAGWRGALGGVLEATLAAMESLGAARRRVTAVLGPTISQAAYEVGPELVDGFRQADPGNERFFRPGARDGHAMFDLPGYIGARLRKAGVGTVADLGRCTYREETLFYSYRRTTHRGEPDYGRLISAIALTP